MTQFMQYNRLKRVQRHVTGIKYMLVFVIFISTNIYLNNIHTNDDWAFILHHFTHIKCEHGVMNEFNKHKWSWQAICTYKANLTKI